MPNDSEQQGSRPIETKEVKTGDTFGKSQRSTYQGPKGPVDLAPQNLVNPTPTESPAPATALPVTDQGGGTGGSDS